MKIPVDSYNNILTVLELSHFGPIFDYFDYQSRKLMCSYLINNVLENGTLIPTQDQVHVKVSIITIIIFTENFHYLRHLYLYIHAHTGKSTLNINKEIILVLEKKPYCTYHLTILNIHVSNYRYCKTTFICVGKMFAGFERVSSLRIFLAASQKINCHEPVYVC